jgi:large subunit ribosomal protein L10
VKPQDAETPAKKERNRSVDRVRKEALVASLHETFGTANLVVITQQSGMTVGEASELRAQMREAGATYKVTKNRLTRRALEGTKFEALQPLFTGPTAIAYSEDPLAAAKVCVAFAKKNEKLTIIGGALEAEQLDPSGIKALASLPSLDELRAKLIGCLQAPATKLAGVVQAPAGQLARVFSAYGSQGDAA